MTVHKILEQIDADMQLFSGPDFEHAHRLHKLVMFLFVDRYGPTISSVQILQSNRDDITQLQCGHAIYDIPTDKNKPIQVSYRGHKHEEINADYLKGF